MSNLIFFAFSKSSATSPLNYICNDKYIQPLLKVQTTKVISQLKQINLMPSQRQKINTGHGSWYCKKDQNQFFYLMLTKQTYSQQLVYQAFAQFTQHLKKIGHSLRSQSDATLKNHSTLVMQQILTRYQNPKNINKISKINNTLDQLRESIRYSTKKIITNQAQIEQIQRKSMTSKERASWFNKSAGQLQKLMYWRNCKIKIIIGLVILSVLCYITIPIIQKIVNKN